MKYLAIDVMIELVLLVLRLLNSVAHLLSLLLHILRHNNYAFGCT